VTPSKQDQAWDCHTTSFPVPAAHSPVLLEGNQAPHPSTFRALCSSQLVQISPELPGK